MFAVPSFFGYNTTFVSTPVATAATGVGETSFTANWNAFAGASYYLLDVSTSSSFSSFVFQDRVIYTNSYAVTGLTASTTYYYRVRASTTYETDAAAFFTRVTSAGGTLTTTEQQAVNSLVIQMKADGIWSAMKAIYPMVGASAAACAQNLKSSSFTGSFTSGWTFASTGVTPNGTSAYMDTGLVPNTELSLNSAHISTYSRTNSAVDGADIGSSDIGGYPGGIYIVQRWSDGNSYPNLHSLTSVTQTGAYPDSRGFFVLRRNNSTQIIMSKNAVNNTISQTSTTKTTTAIALGALRQPTTTTFSNRELAFNSIGDGLTDTQASNFNTAVQAFQTTIGRQV